MRACLHDPARQTKTAGQAGRLRALLSQPTSGSAADWLAVRLGSSSAR